MGLEYLKWVCYTNTKGVINYENFRNSHPCADRGCQYPESQRRGYAKNPADSLIDIRESFGGVRALEREAAPANEIAFITPVMKEGELREILSGLKDFASASVIRIL